MPYAIYQITVAQADHLGIGEMASHLETPFQRIYDSRFFSFGKDPIAVQLDLFRFLADIKRNKDECRVPDELELMYAHEMRPFDGVSPNPNLTLGIDNLQLDQMHDYLAQAFYKTRIEAVEILDDEAEHLIDRALEIVADKHVDIALARVSNPHKLVMDLNGHHARIYAAAKQCVSISAHRDVERYVGELAEVLAEYDKQIAGMRFVNLSQPEKEGN